MFNKALEPPKPNSCERAIIESANRHTAVFSPLLDIRVSWLANGVGGGTLPEELVSVGQHISQPERMPPWLAAKLDAAGHTQLGAQ